MSANKMSRPMHSMDFAHFHNEPLSSTQKSLQNIQIVPMLYHFTLVTPKSPLNVSLAHIYHYSSIWIWSREQNHWPVKCMQSPFKVHSKVHSPNAFAWRLHNNRPIWNSLSHFYSGSMWMMNSSIVVTLVNKTHSNWWFKCEQNPKYTQH